MNSKFYSLGNPRSNGQLHSLSHYREQEQRKAPDGACASDGSLLEYEALELRIHPPNVRKTVEAASLKTSERFGVNNSIDGWQLGLWCAHMWPCTLQTALIVRGVLAGAH